MSQIAPLFPSSLPPPLLRLENLLGRLIELSGGSAAATLTVALRCVREAQQLREPVCWITSRESHFFPPDAAAGGVDLGALVVIRLPQVRFARDVFSRAASHAADLLVRSGGFGLVVLDLSRHLHLPLAVLTRLAALARKHSTALLFLTQKLKDRPSLSSLVSLRVEALRLHKREGEHLKGQFGYEIHVLKDKRPQTNDGFGRLAGIMEGEVCGGPDGLC